MASAEDNRWEELAEPARMTIRWARAMEAADVRTVGTRTLLAAMIREEGSRSAPWQLLNTFGRTSEQLFAVLRGMAAVPSIDPYVERPANLSGLPPLSRNASAALDGAFALRDHNHPVMPVDTRDLFAALLGLQGCSAFRSLAIVLEDRVDLRVVRDLVEDDIVDDKVSGFAGRLDDLLSAGTSSSEPPPSAASESDPSVHEGPVHALAFSPDGSSLASTGEDGMVRGWELEGGATTLVFEAGLRGPQDVLAYSPDGGHLACGGVDGRATVFSLDGDPREELPIPAGDDPAIAAIAYADTGAMAVGRREGPITISTPGSAEVDSSFTIGNPEVADLTALRFAPGGERLLGAGAESLIVWSSDRMETLARLRFKGSWPPLALAFPSDDVAFAYDREGRTWRWDLRDQRMEAVMSHDDAAVAAAFTPDGSHLAVAFADGSVEVGPTGRPEGWRAVDSATGVTAVAISVDATMIATGNAGGFVAVWSTGIEPPRVSSGAEWLSDRPTTADKFGRRRLASALATRLARISGEVDSGSFLLHVDGPWGAGKSSLLDLLEEQLGTGAADGGWLIVRFDAWRQSAVGPPWWALLTALREGLAQSRSRSGRLALRARELSSLLRGYLLSSLLSLLVVAAAVILFLVLGTAESDASSLAQTISAVVAVATTIWLLARGAARAVMWESAGGAKLYEQAEQDPMRALADHFAWLISMSGERRVIFFVDDLDRCGEGYVVELLESIQTLVRDAPRRASHDRDRGGRPPFFVVAADGRWIRRSYEDAYETFQDAVQEPGRRLGYLFLDKIFQLTLRVPEIGREQQARYLDELLRLPAASHPAADGGAGIAAGDGEARIEKSRDPGEILRVVKEARPEARRQLEEAAVERLSDATVERTTEHELQKFAALLEANPRSMKRFVNAYSMALSTQLIAGRVPDTEALALWTILRMRWPELADCLAASPHLLGGIAATGEPPAGLPDSLSPLCDDAELAALLSFGSGSLSVGKIQAMA